MNDTQKEYLSEINIFKIISESKHLKKNAKIHTIQNENKQNKEHSNNKTATAETKV